MGRHASPTATRLRKILVAMSLGALAISSVGPATAADGSHVRVTLGNMELGPAEVVEFHCHDRDMPTIKCFETAGERDGDLSSRASRSARLADPYVTFFQDAGYGGSSYTAYNAISDLGVYGWNDLITSFKSLSGQRPRLYTDVGYGTPSWRWAAGAWVSNVGSAANDVTSSIKNDP